jgi:hypothetical protein
MSIQKKSLISTLKTTKKANVAKEDFAAVGSASPVVKSPSRVFKGTPSKVFKGTPSKVFKGTPSKVFKGTPSKVFKGTPSVKLS